MGQTEDFQTCLFHHDFSGSASSLKKGSLEMEGNFCESSSTAAFCPEMTPVADLLPFLWKETKSNLAPRPPKKFLPLFGYDVGQNIMNDRVKHVVVRA